MKEKEEEKKTKNKRLIYLFISFLSLGGLLSCGLEEFYFIDFISRLDYRDTSATLSLPSGDAEGYSYFNNFIIFYRIYISANNIITGTQLEGSGPNNDRTTINPTLNSDYNGFWSLTNTNTTEVNTANLENTFFNRKYFLLALENNDINNVLGSGSLGKKLDIAFPPNPGENPTLTITNGNVVEAVYVLQRAVDPPAGQNLVYTLQPNRNFFNHPDLYDPAKAVTDINVDVATNTTGTGYTYVSMYIAARGTSLEMPPRTIYSQPTFIGIFRLANSG